MTSDDEKIEAHNKFVNLFEMARLDHNIAEKHCEMLIAVDTMSLRGIDKASEIYYEHLHRKRKILEQLHSEIEETREKLRKLYPYKITLTCHPDCAKKEYHKNIEENLGDGLNERRD